MHSMFIWEESLKFQFELWPPKTLSGGWFCFHRVANFCRAESAMSTILSGKCAQPHCKVNSFGILHRLSEKLGIDLSNLVQHTVAQQSTQERNCSSVICLLTRQPFPCDNACALLAQCDITVNANSCTLNDKTLLMFMSFHFLDEHAIEYKNAYFNKRRRCSG